MKSRHRCTVFTTKETSLRTGIVIATDSGVTPAAHKTRWIAEGLSTVGTCLSLHCWTGSKPQGSFRRRVNTGDVESPLSPFFQIICWPSEKIIFLGRSDQCRHPPSEVVASFLFFSDFCQLCGPHLSEWGVDDCCLLPTRVGGVNRGVFQSVDPDSTVMKVNNVTARWGERSPQVYMTRQTCDSHSSNDESRPTGDWSAVLSLVSSAHGSQGG